MSKSLIVAAFVLAAGIGGASAQEAGTINVWGARLNPTTYGGVFGAPPVASASRGADSRSVEFTGSTDTRPATKRAHRTR